MTNQTGLKDLTNQRFGSLIVIARNSENTKSGNARWDCICDCGNTTTVIGSKLRSGYTTSCGCAKRSEIAQGFSATRLYRIWKGMHNRCYNSQNDNYKWYGGRGIKICDDWHTFIIFREWALTNGYDDGLTIDRIDSNGNYCPENCRWNSIKKQQNNRSSNRYLFYEGKEYTISEFADFLNVPYWTIANQLKLGWDIGKIVMKTKKGEK
ncbi:TPA: hypothetical protein TVQ98_001434 [Streptococcus equi subsp. zooepidemicus]|nr:hypothetical protein [Streptococcus equi subsp. zooepidemicus]HEL0713124.1 hypothetical protein [Streptococcus equi subsp. zooepidemicus]HEL0736896.1 hypothetical protein [Streptococcus equi subsp. zooepidemicus]HEL0768029.1 hypothetical protein [Streptococcus equi subsp. zooepidemicus]HEL1302605.1 hypothetical protein [Streptococcus equi subsp. zooepidemicus]